MTIINFILFILSLIMGIHPAPHAHAPARPRAHAHVQARPKIVTPASRSRSVTSVPLTNDSVWDRLAQCESGGNWSINTGNGFYGGIQFDLSSWQDAGGSGLPSNASRAEQIKRGKIWQARYGWNPWPACSRKLGLL